MTTASVCTNPFELMLDPASVHRRVEDSEQLSRLGQRRCHPLDRAVIRCASAEIAAFDGKVDRSTTYLPPEADASQPLVRDYPHRVN